MRTFRQCSNCVGLLMLALTMTQRVESTAADSGEWEVLWIEKSVNVLKHVKRKEVCAVADWSLCPASVGGGCCPGGFACDTASCYATTGGSTTCNGHVGYYSCPLTAGPGSCCPVGTVCRGGNECVPAPGVAPSCPASYTGCPASLGGGCCKEGMACGSGICFNTTPRTEQVTTKITTTDSRGHTTVTVATSTTVLVDGPNTSATDSGAPVIQQLVPSTVSKLPAIQTDDGGGGGGGGGLSSGALGGIVAGVIVLLVAIVVAATFIVMRLKKAERAAKAAEVAAESRRESNSQPRSHKPGFGQPSVSEIDSTTDIDPSHQFPIMRPSPRVRTVSNPSVSNDRSTPNFTTSGTSSPPIWGVPFNYVPSEGSDGRQSSLDSYTHRDNNNSRQSQRISMDSHGPPYGHSRHPSDTSELEGPHGVSELDTYDNAEAESRRRSNSATRPAKAHVRRTSDPSRNRGDSNAAANSLGTVNEMHELHGHYGPIDAVRGQTAARLDRGPSSSSSHYGP